MASKPVPAIDHFFGAGEDYSSEAVDIAAGKGFNGNGITEFVSTGNITGGSGQFALTASWSWAPLSGNVGGVLFFQGGALIAIPIGWVPSVLPTFGITVLTNLSIFGDYSGIMSYAGQLDLFLNVAPFVDLALMPADWMNSISWQTDKNEFTNVFSENPQPVPAPGRRMSRDRLPRIPEIGARPGVATHPLRVFMPPPLIGRPET